MSEGAVTVEAEFLSSRGPEVTLRQVYLGMSPMVLLEPEIDGDDVTFKVTAVDIDKEDLADLMELIAPALRSGTIQGGAA